MTIAILLTNAAHRLARSNDIHQTAVESSLAAEFRSKPYIVVTNTVDSQETGLHIKDQSNEQTLAAVAGQDDIHTSKRIKMFNGYVDCKIADIEAFQGDVRDIIIISTVRSWTHCCPESTLTNIKAKRFNFALSRAKQRLIVVGNEDALKTCKYWREFLDSATHKDSILMY